MSRKRDRWDPRKKHNARNEPGLPNIIYTHEFLSKARDILATPDSWTKGVLARDAAGRPTEVYDEEATCWCLTGAMLLARFRLLGPFDYHYSTSQQRNVERAWLTLGQVVRTEGGHVSVSSWNDWTARDHAHVIEVLLAAERLSMENHRT